MPSNATQEVQPVGHPAAVGTGLLVDSTSAPAIVTIARMANTPIARFMSLIIGTTSPLHNDEGGHRRNEIARASEFLSLEPHATDGISRDDELARQSTYAVGVMATRVIS